MTERVKYIYDKLLNTIVKNGSDLVSDYCSRFHKTERTFWTDWKVAKTLFDEFNQSEIERINKLNADKSTQSAIKGKKSKDAWVLELQKELDDNRHEESVLDLKTGKVTRYYRTLTPTERKGYIERIAKFEGMDSPAKSEVNLKGFTPQKIIFK